MQKYLGKTDEKVTVKLNEDSSITFTITVKELSKEEFEKAAKGQVTNDFKAMQEVARVGTNFAQSETFAKIAEASGNEELKQVSEVTHSDNFAMAADFAESDKLEDLGRAAKKGDIAGAAAIVEENDELKAVADVAKGAAIDEALGELEDIEKFGELPEGV